jgi:hypothetical protein
LEGLHKFLKTIRYVQKKLNPSLDIEGFLLTMFDSRLNLSKKVVNYMHNYFDSFVFDTVIHRNSKITQAPSFGKSILAYDIGSRGAQNYIQLADELVAQNVTEKELKEVPLIPEEQERIFNKKELSKSTPKEEANFALLEKISNSSVVNEEVIEPHFPENYDTLLNLSKSYIEKLLGSCYRNHYGNIWVYKINKSNIFKKKFLYLYFKNGVVSEYDTKWFSL